MAWTSGFFNSENGDRSYSADQISEMFDGLITNGVYESVGNKLAVRPNDGMTIQIDTGRGKFGKRWAKNDSAYLIQLEDSDVTLNRYAAICVRVDNADSGRTVTPYVKYSEFATSPTKPTMERTETIEEYCLAMVLIPAGATEITAADIEDTRPNAELCGWVTGLIYQVDSNTLWEQWEALFNIWFDQMKDQLSEDAAGNLQAQIDVIRVAVENAQTTADNAMPKTGGNFTSQGVGLNNGKTQLVGASDYAAIDVYFTDTDDIEKFARFMLQKNGNMAVEIWKADTSICYSRHSLVTQAGGSFKGEMWMENPVPAARTNLKNISILNSDWSGASGNTATIRMIRK